MGKSISTLNTRLHPHKKHSIKQSLKYTIESDKSTDTNVKEPLKYYLPNFMKDTDYMVIGHFLARYIFQSIHSAPIGDKLANEHCKVLDVGCGPGTWLLDSATKYHSSRFLGVDLCSVYPAEIKPENVEFMQADILNGLPFDDNTFDYVHQGNMIMVLTRDKWKFIIPEIIRVCKPGGYIEFHEPELSTNAGPILSRFYESYVELSASRDVNVRFHKELLEFFNSLKTIQNVETDTKRIQLGTKKGGNAGQIYWDIHEDFFLNEPMPETMCKFMNLSQDEYFDLFKEAKKEVESGIAPDCEVFRIWCQKKY